MPRNRRGRPAAALLTAFVLGAAACGGGGSDDGAERSTDSTTTSSTTSTTTTVALGPVAPYTGEEIPEDSELLERPATVVKISNNDARSLASLVGIEQADIVIEERIEDRATRFFAIFHSRLPEVVGPIRSGRSSDLDLLAGLGTPILVYSGAQAAVEAQLRGLEADGDVLRVVDDASGVNLSRDNDFARPDNLFADLVFVVDKFAVEAGEPRPIVEFATPGAARPAGEVGLGVTVTGRDVVSFVFVLGRGYVRVQDGEVHATREDEPLVVDNVAILETAYDPSRLVSGSVDAVTVGSGPATILVDGEMWSGSWERADRMAPYRFLDADGEQILLDPGRTWISLAPPGTYELDVDPEIVELAGTVDG